MRLETIITQFGVPRHKTSKYTLREASKAAQEAEQASESGDSAGGAKAGAGADNVVDADFEEVDERDRNKSA